MLPPSDDSLQGDGGPRLWVRKHNGASGWPWPPAACRRLPRTAVKSCRHRAAWMIGWREILQRLSKCGTLALKACWRNLGGSVCPPPPFFCLPTAPGSNDTDLTFIYRCTTGHRRSHLQSLVDGNIHTATRRTRKHTRQAGVAMATNDKAGDLGGISSVPLARLPVSCSSLRFKGQLLVNAVCEDQNDACFTSKVRTSGLLLEGSGVVLRSGGSLKVMVRR